MSNVQATKRALSEGARRWHRFVSKTLKMMHDVCAEKYPQEDAVKMANAWASLSRTWKIGAVVSGVAYPTDIDLAWFGPKPLIDYTHTPWRVCVIGLGDDPVFDYPDFAAVEFKVQSLKQALLTSAQPPTVAQEQDAVTVAFKRLGGILRAAGVTREGYARYTAQLYESLGLDKRRDSLSSRDRNRVIRLITTLGDQSLTTVHQLEQAIAIEGARIR